MHTHSVNPRFIARPPRKVSGCFPTQSTPTLVRQLFSISLAHPLTPDISPPTLVLRLLIISLIPSLAHCRVFSPHPLLSFTVTPPVSQPLTHMTNIHLHLPLPLFAGKSVRMFSPTLFAQSMTCSLTHIDCERMASRVGQQKYCSHSLQLLISVTRPHGRSFNHSVTHSLTHSPSKSVSQSVTHSFTQ